MVYSSRERSQTALDVWQDVAGISQLNALSKASTAKSPNSSKGLRSHQGIEASQRIESGFYQEGVLMLVWLNPLNPEPP